MTIMCPKYILPHADWFVLTQLVSFWKREPQIRKCPHPTSLWASLWCVVMIGDWCRKVQLTTGIATRDGCSGAL